MPPELNLFETIRREFPAYAARWLWIRTKDAMLTPLVLNRAQQHRDDKYLCLTPFRWLKSRPEINTRHGALLHFGIPADPKEDQHGRTGNPESTQI